MIRYSYIYSFFLFTIIFQFGYSQGDSSKLESMFKEGEEFLSSGDFIDALYIFKDIEEKGESTPVLYSRIGECYLNIPEEKHLSIEYLEKSVKGFPKENLGEKDNIKGDNLIYTNYLLGKAYRLNNENEKSISLLDSLSNIMQEQQYEQDQIEIINQELRMARNSKIIQTNPVKVSFENLGERINNSFSNFNPVVTYDESKMFFVNEFKFYDAIMYSETECNKWSFPQNLTPKLKSDGQYQCVYISRDETVLFLKGFNPETGSIDLYTSLYKEGNWNELQLLNNNINTKYDETHACLSPDGSTLYFTSNKPGGYGGFDIYKSELDCFNDWGAPENLGSIINTPDDEATPFITKDGMVMFFSSKGHKTIGGYDVFYSQKSIDESWLPPVNIGYPVNTTDDDLFFIPVKNGKAAYYSRLDKNGYGKKDIIRVNLGDIIHPQKVKLDVFVNENDQNFMGSGKLFLVNTRNNDTIEFNFINNEDENPIEVDEIQAGVYKVKLIPGTTSLIEQEVAGNIPLEDEVSYPDSIKPMSVSELEDYLIFNPIFFEYNSWELNEKAKKQLDNMSKMLLQYSEIIIVVTGHTDEIGSAEINQAISWKRADAVAEYLVEKGISPGKIIKEAKGEKDQIARNFNDDGTINKYGTHLNRRVELRFK